MDADPPAQGVKIARRITDRRNALPGEFVPRADSCTAAKNVLFDYLVGEPKECRWHR